MPPKEKKEKKPEEKKPAAAVAKPAFKKVYKDHKDKSQKRKGYTEKQIANRQKRLRKPKAWDLKYRKKTIRGLRYKNVLEEYPELLALLTASGKFNRNLLKVNKRYVSDRVRVTKRERKLRALPPHLKRVYSHAENKTKSTWSFKKYRLLFGAYASEESLVKYFKDNANAATFVKRNTTHNMNLGKLIQLGRQRLTHVVRHKSRQAPEIITSDKDLVTLKKEPAYVKFMELVLGADASTACHLLQSYVVQLLRNKCVADEALKAKTIAFAKV